MQADAAMSRHQPGEQEKAVRNGKFSQPDDPDISIRLVRLGDIKFDGYQRGTRRTSQSVHDHYNAHLYQPLELSERKNGDLYGIDGKQRHAGRIKLDGPDTMVLARVHQGLDVAA